MLLIARNGLSTEGFAIDISVRNPCSGSVIQALSFRVYYSGPLVQGPFSYRRQRLVWRSSGGRREDCAAALLRGLLLGDFSLLQ